MELGRLGLGTFPFSHVFGPTNESEIEQIIHAYFALGGKYVQTAPYYAGVDPILKRLLKNISRSEYCLGTLCVKDRKGIKDGSYSAIIEQCEDSLTELGVDYLDVLMTASAKGGGVPFSETIGAMADLKAQGKIRSIGVCNVDLDQLKEYNENGNVSFVQNRYSLIDRSLDDDFIEYCSSHNIKLIPYNVIEWGILTNRFLGGMELRETDFRLKLSKVFNDVPMCVLRHWSAKHLVPVSRKFGTSIEALAIFWVMNQRQVSTPVIGASKKNQIESSMDALRLEKGSEIIEELNNAYFIFAASVKESTGKELNEFLRNSYILWGT